mmetsp:Transcript_23884/g.77127  ORF Transcript_23884/g.77127 Transcript_23884/m.77127 type:complete len:292 (+) Transcript_23884:1186-2061(+)
MRREVLPVFLGRIAPREFLCAVARDGGVGGVGPADAFGHLAPVEHNAVALKHLLPSRAKNRKLGDSDRVDHGADQIPRGAHDERAIDHVRLEHGLRVVAAEHLRRLLHQRDEVLLQVAGAEPGAVDHHDRLGQPLALLVRVGHVARALGLGGVHDVLHDLVQLKRLEEPGYLDPPQTHQLDHVAVRVAANGSSLVELLEQAAVGRRRLEDAIGSHDLPPLHILLELDEGRLGPVRLVRVAAQEARQQVLRHLYKLLFAQPLAHPREHVKLLLVVRIPFRPRLEVLHFAVRE